MDIVLIIIIVALIILHIASFEDAELTSLPLCLLPFDQRCTNIHSNKAMPQPKLSSIYSCSFRNIIIIYIISNLFSVFSTLSFLSLVHTHTHTHKQRDTSSVQRLMHYYYCPLPLFASLFTAIILRIYNDFFAVFFSSLSFEWKKFIYTTE